MDEKWSKPIKGWLIMSPCPVHSCIHPFIGTHDQGESIGTETKTCTQRGTDTLIPNTFLTLFFDNQSITIDRVAQFFFFYFPDYILPHAARDMETAPHAKRLELATSPRVVSSCAAKSSSVRTLAETHNGGR